MDTLLCLIYGTSNTNTVTPIYACLKIQFLKFFDIRTWIRFSVTVRVPLDTRYPEFPGNRVVTRLCPISKLSKQIAFYIL